MEYKLASAEQKGMPYEKKADLYKLDSPMVFGADVVIKTRISNQVYVGFENVDLAFCPLEKTDDPITVSTKIDAFAKAYILEKYPNT